jgi:squalene-hopene/tetraprenyl-beta-curcumene cyclase
MRISGSAGFINCAIGASRALAVLMILMVMGGLDAFAARASAVETWSPSAAAQYLDQRATWWESWPNSKRDHDTVCVSCHTILPYVLSRSKLSAALAEKGVPGAQSAALGHVKKRVRLWSEVQPYYLDAKSGPGKSRESRATESVLNALVLASSSADQKRLDPLARKAFDAAWALQLKSGEHAGAWDWQVFHLAPWEAGDSQYQGATFMALAVGWAPEHYRRDRAVQANLRLLRAYLRREYASQTLLNKMVLLWASEKFPGILSRGEKKDLVAAVRKQQQKDGGWNLSTLGAWERSDHTTQDNASDGYATALATLALGHGHDRRQEDAWKMGRTWLEQHQNKEDGSWRTYSLNKKRDLKTDVGKFMTDAATGYAVLALEQTR